MREAKAPDGSPLFTVSSVIGLIVFFMIALQCISTVAIVRRETNSWKWTGFMFVYLVLLAYVAALATFWIATWAGLGAPPPMAAPPPA